MSEKIQNLFVTPSEEGKQPDFILNPELPQETGYMFQEEKPKRRGFFQKFLERVLGKKTETSGSYEHIEGSRYRVNGQDVYIKRCKTPDTVSWQHPIRQALLQASLDHPNIAKCIGLVQIDNDQITANDPAYGRLHEVGIVMEYVDGKNILDYVSTLQKGEDLIPIFRQLISLFRYLDKKGVVHADITLNNLIVTKDGVVKLIDFDLARFCDPNNPHKERIGVGTYPYYPPEQIVESYIDKIDVYSLGVVIKALLEKKKPSEQIRGRVQLHQDFRDIFPKPDIDISKIDQITQEYPIDNLNKLLQGATQEIVDSRLSMKDFLDGLEKIFNETSKTS